MTFLFVGSSLCVRLPSDIASRLCPCLSLVVTAPEAEQVVTDRGLAPHQVIAMLGVYNRLNRSFSAAPLKNEQRRSCEQASITENTIVTASAWRTGELAAVYGIVAINGEHVEIEENDVSNALFGIWVCDKNGEVEQNKLHGNFNGLMFCRVAEFDFTLPSGQPAPAEFPATSWRAEDNNSFDNLDAGYLVIDGSNNNVLTNNNGSNNGTYDIELAGDSNRYGFFTPKSFKNKVVAGRFRDVKIKNCGENNTVIGGQLVDNTQDPCF